MGYFTSETELAHHGILGQKWGKVSGPPYPLSTKQHTSVVRRASNAERLAAIERGGGSAASLHTTNAKKTGRAGKLLNKVTKMDVSALKVRSASDLKNVKKYIATYMLGKNEVDTLLKANTKFSRIQTSKEMEEFPFYATYKKHDVNMYEGLFGKNLKNRALAEAKASGDAEQIQKAKDMEVYRVELKNTKGLKVPSDENAGKITAGLLKDKEFKENLKASIDDSREKMKRPSQQMLFKKADKALEKHPEPGLDSKDKKNLYKALNLTLTNHNSQEVAMQKTFYNEMKKKGYHALVDTNDQEYSSYHAKRPMIVFDTASTSVDKVHTLNEKRVNRLNKVYNTERILKESVEQIFGTPMKALSHSEGGYDMYYAVDDTTEDLELEHHGILGQKWGVRRFQNKDGTLTPAGRRRVNSEDSDDAQNEPRRSGKVGKTVAKAALGALAVGGTAYLLANPTTRQALSKYGKTAVSKIGDFAKSEKVKEAGKKVGKKLGERAEKVGNAMIDAGLLSVGAIGISKLEKSLATDENASEAEKNRNKILLDTATAGIKAATGSISGNNNNKNNTWSDKTGTHAGKEITDKIGKPSNQNIDRSSKAWQDLFKDSNGNQRDADTRATIKSLANAGYDIDQIDKWLNHAEFAEWNESFVFSEFRW